MLRTLLEHFSTKPRRRRGRVSRRLRSGDRRRARSSRLRFEALEERALLASLTVSGADETVSEIEGSGLTFEVTLDESVPGGFTVEVTLADVTATGGAGPLTYPQDYDNVVAQLNFSGMAGETHQFTVATLDDQVVEGTETFTVSLSASDALVDDSHIATGTIINDDHATLSVADAMLLEGDDGTMILSFPVTLDAPVDVDVSVDYTTQDIKARAAEGDYEPVITPATLSIAAGETTGNIRITVNGDDVVEPHETFHLLLGNLQALGRSVTLAQTSWFQIGQDINGGSQGNRLGALVSLSGDGNIVAMNVQSGLGAVRMYQFDGAAWNQLGEDIVAEGLRDGPVTSLSMSRDGTTVAIGASQNDGNGNDAGHARVFRFDGTAWSQLGEDIDGDIPGDAAGMSVSLDSDGDTLAVGAGFNDGNGDGSGQTRVYRYDGAKWVRMGQELYGEGPGDHSGREVSLSGDGNTVAIGAPTNEDGGFAAGHVRVYSFDGVSWNQLGEDIDGKERLDLYGISVSLSDDGKTVAAGSTLNNDSDERVGHARVFRFDGTQWLQIGQELAGAVPGDQFGTDLELSADGNMVVIGAPGNDENGGNAGLANVYRFDGTSWQQLAQSIYGEATNGSGDGSISVSLSSDGSTVAYGAPHVDLHGTDSGRTRMYRLQPVVAGTIADDDDVLTITDASVVEGFELNFTVHLEKAAQDPFTVEIMLVDETATGGIALLDYPEDYGRVVASLTFQGLANETRRFKIPTHDDSVVELRETFTVRLRSSDSRITDSDTGTGTIDDDDQAILRVADATATEVDGGMTILAFPLTLDAAVDVDVSVDYTTLDGIGSAAHGDYTPVTTPSTATIKAGDTAGTIEISIVGDSTIEPHETLHLLLSNLQASGRDVTLEDWIQLGQDINGEASGDNSGLSVSLSGDGRTLAAGARTNDGNGEDSGHTRLYRFDGLRWNQLGQDIDGSAARVNSGRAVSLSYDGNTVAIGEIRETPLTSPAGKVRVYHFDGGQWNHLGQDIEGEAFGDRSGVAVSLSGDGNTLVIGAPDNNGNGLKAGQARVYRLDGTRWIQVGKDIDGEAAGDAFGSAVALSRDGDTLVVGAPTNDGNERDSGQARIYRFDGTNWVQIGSDLDGEMPGDHFGNSVSINADGNVFAVGGVLNDGSGDDAGHVRVYRLDGASLIQLGSDIDGSVPDGRFGFSVSLSDDGNTVAIGSIFVGPYAGTYPGQAQVQHFDGTDWVQMGQSINGRANDGFLGYSISLSGAGSTLLVGSPFNRDNGFDAGQARVYRLVMGTIVDDDSLLVEFSQPSGMDVESSGENLPRLLVTGTIQAGNSVTIDMAAVGGTATGDGLDYSDPTAVTIPAGTYNATAVPISGLSIIPDTFIELDETIELGTLIGSQVQVGDANGDGTVQASTRYTIQDDDVGNFRTAVGLNGASMLTIRDVVSDGKNDQLELSIAGDQLVITDPNNILGDLSGNTTGTVVSVPLASFRVVEISLAGGDDELSIDFSGAPASFNLSVRISGGDGHDTLTFSGASPLDTGELSTNDEVEDIFINGPITMQNGTIAFAASQSLEVNADISIGTGTIQLVAGRDIFGNCSLIQAGNADVDLVARTGIASVRIETTGDVSLNSGSGGIAGCNGQITVRAQTLTLIAGNSVGTAHLTNGHTNNEEPFLTSVDMIQGTVGGLGIFLVNDRPLIDNVVLSAAPPLGIRNVCPGPTCDLSESEGSPLRNTANEFDVNDDGSVSPVDVLAIINHLHAAGVEVLAEGSSNSQGRFYLDVNGDRATSPLDALMIINYLNTRSAVHAEGESTGSSFDLAVPYYAAQLIDNHLIAASSVSPGESRLIEGNSGATTARNQQTSVVPPVLREPCIGPAPMRQANLKDEMAAQAWESLLDELAEDAAQTLSPC